MRVVEVEGFRAVCEAKGISRAVNLFLLGEGAVVPGDHVLVHVGTAIQKVSADYAESSWALLEEILAKSDASGDRDA
jgi:hydrogenase expression/formation protein HypC